MNEKYIWAIAAFVAGLIIAKGAKPSATDTQAHNETTTSGDWWTYAGGWRV